MISWFRDLVESRSAMRKDIDTLRAKLAEAECAAAAFVHAVDDAIVDWVRGDKMRCDAILKRRRDLRAAVPSVDPLLGDDYANHADALAESEEK
jgi:hypothetical protein